MEGPQKNDILILHRENCSLWFALFYKVDSIDVEFMFPINHIVNWRWQVARKAD